ncbi:MAG: nucleoside triphosphate pyrophosphohydrolase [Leptospira sp.]|jgi:MazG family protein|nr:nucleoside triphosphate pyrophosphohydrolase [Leptospira sp.]
MIPPNSPNPIQNLLQLAQDLRSPTGCPWDKEQNHKSVIPHLLEEVYEVVDTIENNDDPHLKEELGDLLFQIVFHCQLANERDAFQWDDVVNGIVEKLIRRHPHVYENSALTNSSEVLLQWDEIKKKEKANKSDQSILADIPRALPAIQRSEKIQSKVSKQGFDWDHPLDLFTKLKEEISELEEAIGNNPRMDGKKIAYDENIEEELGDIFFLMVNLSKKLSLDPETTLRKANQKFENRFQILESLIAQNGETIKGKPLSELDQYWAKAKEILKNRKA